MGRFANAFGPDHPAETYIEHAIPESNWDTGEVLLNYATTGRDDLPALLLIPGQTESWWGYEQAMPLLAERFQVFAVDLRGQGRSTRNSSRFRPTFRASAPAPTRSGRSTARLQTTGIGLMRRRIAPGETALTAAVTG